MFFLDNVLPENVAAQLDRGVMVGAGRREDSAEVGRVHTGRTMPLLSPARTGLTRVVISDNIPG